MAASVFSTVSEAVVSKKLSALPALIAIAVAAVETSSDASLWLDGSVHRRRPLAIWRSSSCGKPRCSTKPAIRSATPTSRLTPSWG